MERELQPILCLADSQLLFWRDDAEGGRWLARFLPPESEAPTRAAYVGASNGDEPAFYTIFAGAMESLGVTDHRMIRSQFGEEDRDWLATANLVLLAGGDPVRGWRVFEQSGLGEAITARHFAGATLVGISAGAVQLGWLAGPETDGEGVLGPGDVIPTFRLVPAVVGAHEEGDEWRQLRGLLRAAGAPVRGLGIPSGGGLVYHPDGVVEPVRHPVHELVPDGNALRHNLLLPGRRDTGNPASAAEVH